MTESAWRYLEKIWDLYPDGDTIEAMNDLWPDVKQAMQELVEAYVQVCIAKVDKPSEDALVSESEDYSVGGLPYELTIMKQVLGEGLLAIGAPVIEYVQGRFSESADAGQKSGFAILLTGFGEAASGCVPMILAEVANPASPEERFGLRCTAAAVLGRLGVASPEVIETLVQISGDADEAQPLRSYCIEALMDLGPSARAAIPALEQVAKDESEDEDLRRFARSALKSVGASSPDHPCGGTVAEHMRSLYRAVPE